MNAAENSETPSPFVLLSNMMSQTFTWRSDCSNCISSDPAAVLYIPWDRSCKGRLLCDSWIDWEPINMLKKSLDSSVLWEQRHSDVCSKRREGGQKERKSRDGGGNKENTWSKFILWKNKTLVTYICGYIFFKCFLAQSWSLIVDLWTLWPRNAKKNLFSNLHPLLYFYPNGGYGHFHACSPSLRVTIILGQTVDAKSF